MTICINNAKRPPVNGGHQLSDDTQTDWNGIVGRIELQAHDVLWIEAQRVFPKNDGSVRIEADVRNDLPVSGRIAVTIREKAAGRVLAKGSGECPAAPQGRVVVALKLDRPPKLWSEFSPGLYVAESRLLANDGRLLDTAGTTFGFREFTTRGTQFCLNGRVVFLRGKHDACVFPRTGYPPTDVAGWTWRAEDREELRLESLPLPLLVSAGGRVRGCGPAWRLPSAGATQWRRMAVKSRRRPSGAWRRGGASCAYGEHPSFVMMALGNELEGGREVREHRMPTPPFDPRHLFAQASNYDLGNPTNSPLATTTGSRSHSQRRGRRACAARMPTSDVPLGHIQTGPPGPPAITAKPSPACRCPSSATRSASISPIPDFKEIAKYTRRAARGELPGLPAAARCEGHARPGRRFRRRCGALSVICYREEIEAALRTPGFGGFQLLDLQDYPGQGTALVGILDAFMDSKGLIAPETWREFCCETVPLRAFSLHMDDRESFGGGGRSGELRAGLTFRQSGFLDAGRRRGTRRSPPAVFAQDIPKGAW